MLLQLKGAFRRGQKKDHYVNPLLKVSSYITGFLTDMFLFPGKYLYDKMRYPWQYHNLKPSKSPRFGGDKIRTIFAFLQNYTNIFGGI